MLDIANDSLPLPVSQRCLNIANRNKDITMKNRADEHEWESREILQEAKPLPDTPENRHRQLKARVEREWAKVGHIYELLIEHCKDDPSALEDIGKALDETLALLEKGHAERKIKALQDFKQRMPAGPVAPETEAQRNKRKYGF
ncbi:hypothetical protein ACFE33_12860 [Falsihalocynthiibacter sp. SS001]|uniref:hypothetical protein n=1 Tax=Falsihalocynthiibacter sp. SS001 TaxID=3349698 RepID=UPI0036D2F5C0